MCRGVLQLESKSTSEVERSHCPSNPERAKRAGASPRLKAQLSQRRPKQRPISLSEVALELVTPTSSFASSCRDRVDKGGGPSLALTSIMECGTSIMKQVCVPVPRVQGTRCQRLGVGLVSASKIDVAHELNLDRIDIQVTLVCQLVSRFRGIECNSPSPQGVSLGHPIGVRTSGKISFLNEDAARQTRCC